MDGARPGYIPRGDMPGIYHTSLPDGWEYVINPYYDPFSKYKSCALPYASSSDLFRSYTRAPRVCGARRAAHGPRRHANGSQTAPGVCGAALDAVVGRASVAAAARRRAAGLTVGQRQLRA